MNVCAIRPLVTSFSLAATLLAAVPSSGTAFIQDSAHWIGFSDFLDRILAADNVHLRRKMAEDYVENVRRSGEALVHDSTVWFLYHGNGTRVSVAGDINGWNPAADTMTRVPGTDLHYLTKTLHPAARFEYKIVVDSNWILDPLNPRQAAGGFGPNSEIRMPAYRPPTDTDYRQDIPHGRIDSLLLHSSLLGRSHPVFVYLPPGYDSASLISYPVMYVTDGAEYMSLGGMTNALDNLQASNQLCPLVAIFVDPRTDMKNPATSMRMTDYTLNTTFVRFLIEEVRASLMKQYRLTTKPSDTGIMGASLGGLIATYATLTRPDVFGFSAAQSPSYWWSDGAIYGHADSAKERGRRFYIDTGMIRDAQEGALRMKAILERGGHSVHYAEHPESHNWTNWRARIGRILQIFCAE